MQTAISWYNYAIAVLVISGLYYIFIGFKFYRQDITAFFSRKWKTSNTASVDDHEEAEFTTSPYGEAMEGSFDELEEVVQDLKTAILDKAGNTGKDDLLDLLKQRLANYTGLRRPAFRVAVNHFIIRQAEETCGVAFSEDELNEAWRTLPR